jgi:hypothetical protein
MSKILKIIHKFCGIFYNFFDNMVWIANMGAMYKHLIKKTLKWRDVKDLFSFIKNICGSIRSLIKFNQTIEKESEL